VDSLHFPFNALDPEVNAECSRRARALAVPTRSEIGALDPSEWLCRLFFFAPQESDDLVISVCGTMGAVATEVRWPTAPLGDQPNRETYRLEETRASVFRDIILRLDPWAVEPDIDPAEAPRLVMEFIEQDRYACLAALRPPAQSPEHEIARAFCDLWPERTAKHLQYLES